LEFGGPSGVRDLGLVESALHRPQRGYYEDLVGMAAARFESLLMNHPFVDGNKRRAFFATDVSSGMNGWKPEVDADPAHALLIGALERKDAGFSTLAGRIREHVAELRR
jgi:death-on-curing protein